MYLSFFPFQLSGVWAARKVAHQAYQKENIGRKLLSSLFCDNHLKKAD